MGGETELAKDKPHTDASREGEEEEVPKVAVSEQSDRGQYEGCTGPQKSREDSPGGGSEQ